MITNECSENRRKLTCYQSGLWHDVPMTSPPNPYIGFRNLFIKDWRQFKSVSLDFHPRLTVLTGANASGKTTLLNLLGRHFDWTSQYLGSPKMSPRGLSWKIDNRFSDMDVSRTIGELEYSNGVVVEMTVKQASPTYDVVIRNQQFVPGIYLPSHRALSAYQQLASLPSQFSASDQLFKNYYTEISNRWRGQFSPKTPMLQMKESLMAAALYGYSTMAIEANSEAREVWTGFQRVLRELLPSSLGFIELSIRPPEIVIRTHSGDFLIDAVSGGTSSLIEISWQIFLRSREFSAFTVCMDEPENHLHPALQRSIIPALLNAFPHITFIVATHSPFIVTSVDNSHVYVLDYEEGLVSSRLLDSVSKSASSDEVLRRVLGLETTAPLWVERRLGEILEGFDGESLNAGELRRLRDELRRIGLGQEFPAVLDALTLGENDASSQ
jgi:energy-coupling factor transporter ATP-binding protein EcfA2